MKSRIVSRIDLSPAQVALVRQVLARHIADREAWAFGAFREIIGKGRFPIQVLPRDAHFPLS